MGEKKGGPGAAAMFLCLYISLLLLFGRGCAGDNLNRGFYPGESRLTMGVNRDLEAVPFLLGLEKGYFGQEGLSLKLEMVSHPAAVLDLLRSGAVDGAVLPLGDLVMLRQEGFLVKITSEAPGGYGLVAAPESGIAGVEELKGATLGLLPTEGGKQAAEILLQKEGLSLPEVNIKEIASLKELPRADAYVLPLLAAAIEESRGGRLLAEAGEREGAAPVIVFIGEVLQEERETITRFYRGYRRALEHLQEGSEDSQNIAPRGEEVSLMEMSYPRTIKLPAEEAVSGSLERLKRRELLQEEMTRDQLVVEDFAGTGEDK